MTKLEVKDAFNFVLLGNAALVGSICAEILKRKTVYISQKRLDHIRLLNLQTWADRYNISLEEVLKVLLQVWHGKYSPKLNQGLGVNISTLTGVRSKAIIQDYVKKTYPGGENKIMRKLELQDTIKPKEIITEWDSPVEFISEYKKHIAELRKEDKKVADKFTRRRYRNNPWI